MSLITAQVLLRGLLVVFDFLEIGVDHVVITRGGRSAGLLTVAGASEWWIDLEVRLHRLRENRNRLLLEIWRHLAAREGSALL